MGFVATDELLAMFVPVVVYWVYSGIYEMLGSFEDYRLHSRRDEDAKNLVSKRDVVRGVLFQQAIQVTVSLLVLKVTGESNTGVTIDDKNPSLMGVGGQLFIAMLVLDTWQYFMHRCMHLNKFLYRNFHSWHHRLVAPYAFGAQYNHPVDGLLVETFAGAMAFFVSGMSVQTSIFFFSFATIKGIDDHCGLQLPWNPFHLLFTNNAAYHEVHHQLVGNKFNFSQPFFVMWDKILGTHVPHKLEKRVGGGFEIRLVKD